MKLTPSSTARRKTFFAFSRSGGQPQIPSPVRRIAPKPSRLTSISPPSKNVLLLLMLMLPLASGIAAISLGNPPVRTPAALAESAVKNVRRVTSLCIGFPFLLLTLLGPAAPARLASKNVRHVITDENMLPRSVLNSVKERGSNGALRDRKSTRLNSSHDQISYAVFCLKKK